MKRAVEDREILNMFDVPVEDTIFGGTEVNGLGRWIINYMCGSSGTWNSHFFTTWTAEMSL